jgi:hypothetical protein
MENICSKVYPEVYRIEADWLCILSEYFSYYIFGRAEKSKLKHHPIVPRYVFIAAKILLCLKRRCARKDNCWYCYQRICWGFSWLAWNWARM